MDKVKFYRRFMWPFINRLTLPDRAHNRAIRLGALLQSRPGLAWLAARASALEGRPFASDRLTAQVSGIDLESPLMLAAGFDKEGVCTDVLHRIGFGAVVVGTVLEYPQPGNPKPTIFRPAPGVILNRMGFPSDGMRQADLNLSRRRLDAPLGVSVGLNKNRPHTEAPAAYAAVVKQLYDHAAFFEINVSSPNTPDLRKLQNQASLVDIIQAANHQMEASGGKKPLFIKVAPDLTYSAVDDVIAVALDQGVSGIVATNTTINPDVKAALGARWANEPGGVSGLPLRNRSTEIVRHIYGQAGHQLAVIGAGGIFDLESALEKLKAGASALQIYTALIYNGPSFPDWLNRQLDGWLQDNGCDTIHDIIGTDNG